MIAVIGLGLIGGSISQELKAQGHQVIGVDKNAKHSARALELNLVSSILELDQALVEAETIIVCVPVNTLETIIPQILDLIREDQVVLDVGSTKLSICNAVLNHRNRKQFVACHPMAGTEHSGPDAALMGLFRGKKNIICEKDRSSEEAVLSAIKIFNQLGMESYFMEAEEHDKHMAFVSHLSHVSSFALSKTVLEIEKDEKQIFNLASTGFESTARLAKCNPDTWTAIFSKNKNFLSQALEAYIDQMQQFKKLLDELNLEAMHEAIVEANQIERVLKGIKLNRS